MTNPASTPFFSVVIPTYNRSTATTKAVKSVLAQSYSSFEVIVVDDGSTDDTASLIQTLSAEDERVIYVFQENQERSSARNRGIELANGEFICFLDSDDTFLPTHLKELKLSIDDNERAQALYYVNGELKTAEKAVSITFPRHIQGGDRLEYVLCRASIPTSFVCIPKEILKKHRFNTSLYVGEDKELWARIVLEYPIVHSSQQTVFQNDLGDRTVDIGNLKTAKQNLLTTKYIINQMSVVLSKSLTNKMLSAAYFKLAQSYLVNRQRMRAVLYTSVAILKYRDKYTPSLVIFAIRAAGLDMLLPSRFKQPLL